MPLIDMPVEKLLEYEGRNPKPEGFAAYWSEALDEMWATDPRVELRRSDFSAPYADCFDLFFTGVGGARVHARALRPKKADKPRPALLCFHGYSGSTGDWTNHLAYAAAGFEVFAMDCRGQGGASEDVGGVVGNTLHGHIVRGLDGDPRRLLYRQIYLDTAMLARIVMDLDEVDEKRVGARGGSQGGGLTLACAALEPRIAKAAPEYPFLCDYQRVWEMDLAKGAYQELTDYFRRFDPRHQRHDEVFRKLGHIDLQHLAGRIRAEVLMGTGLMDTICPPSTQFAAFNKIKSPKKVEFYPDFGHETLPGFGDLVFEFMCRDWV
jgi:cephalosporin-C deacetylase